MDPEEKRLKDFLKERTKILNDIEQFLRVVLIFLVDAEKKNFPLEDITIENVSDLIGSLCLIHGLYGYPAKSDPSTEPEETGVNKHAVRDIILNTIKEENDTRMFVHYFEEIAQDQFWQKFEFTGGMPKLHREPAHIVLQMVRDLFGNRTKASIIGRSVLESLRDGSWLKPKVWAEHKERKDRYGVSLRVQSFLRPLYLYNKINELRNVENCSDCLILEDVSALIRKKMKNKSEKSKYKTEIKPCKSCNIFFSGTEQGTDGKFNPFANCAEYDVIRTTKLDDVLSEFNDSWQDFETACKKHLSAFNDLEKVENQSQDEQIKTIKTYFRDARRNAKILMYSWKEDEYKLVSEAWHKTKSKS